MQNEDNERIEISKDQSGTVEDVESRELSDDDLRAVTGGGGGGTTDPNGGGCVF